MKKEMTRTILPKKVLYTPMKVTKSKTAELAPRNLRILPPLRKTRETT